MGSAAIATAYSDLLARERWQWFCTLTFRQEHRLSTGGLLPEKADKAFRWFIRQLNERMYDTKGRWRRSHGGVIWARGTEQHANGRPHFHAVLAAPDQDLNVSLQRYAWHELWFREFGRNQIEQPRNQDEVNTYVSKYVTKDGQIDFSPNFGAQHPPSLPWWDGNEGSRAAKPSHPETRHCRPGGSSQGTAARQCLSLTLPVRPQFANPTFHSSDLENQKDLDL